MAGFAQESIFDTEVVTAASFSKVAKRSSSTMQSS